MKRPALHAQILLALVLAVVAGVLLGEKARIFEPLGTLFLNALKMIVVPLIVCSIVTGVAGIGGRENFGRMGGKTLLYYLVTSLLAILTGLTLVNLVRPGVGANLGLQASVSGDWAQALQERAGGSPWQTLQDLMIRMVPTNPVQAMVEGEMIQVIVFCLLFGYFSTRVAEPYRSLIRNLFEGGFEIMMKLTRVIILLAPVGIFGLVAKIVATSGLGVFQSLGWYALTVFAGLVVHATVTLPLLLWWVGRVSPRKHVQAMAAALLTAFSTSSSSATLPVTLESVEKNAGVSNPVSSFVLPLGATVNMDGTALYECVAALFIAQAYGVTLGFVQQFIVVVTALLVSIGAAGIPMAGVVMMAVILKAVGLPLEGVGLILAVDRILDMCRTTVNVWSDSCGAVIIARTEGETLPVQFHTARGQACDSLRKTEARVCRAGRASEGNGPCKPG